MRQRSGSVKRKLDDQMSYATVVSSAPVSVGFHSFLGSEKIEKVNTNIATVNSLCEKIETASETVTDPTYSAIFKDISAALKLINTNHTEIVNQPAPPPPVPVCIFGNEYGQSWHDSETKQGALTGSRLRSGRRPHADEAATRSG
jgi:hypothetical protein